jgi:HAD superfamily hydrolase (TIGR01509 family)
VPANTPKSIRLISFDLDDTLWDVTPALEAAEAAQWRYLERRYPDLTLRHVSRDELSQIRSQLLAEQPALAHQISLFRETFIGRLLEAKGIAPKEATEAAEQAFAAFFAERHEVAVYEDAPAVLESLGKSFLLGALTNGNADVKKTSIGDYFDFAWRAEHFGVSKPDPELFQRAFKTAGLTAEQVIHVGDCHDNDVSGAIKAGARAIWYSPTGESSDTASAVIRQLSELPDAIDELVDSLN